MSSENVFKSNNRYDSYGQTKWGIFKQAENEDSGKREHSLMNVSC
jgi:hypothetical protein